MSSWSVYLYQRTWHAPSVGAGFGFRNSKYENKILDSSSWFVFQPQQFKIILLAFEVRSKGADYTFWNPNPALEVPE